MHIVFIYLFIIQKDISLLRRLCFLYLIPVVVVEAKKMLMSFGHRGDTCARKGLSPCFAALACHMIHWWLAWDPGMSNQCHFLRQFQFKYQETLFSLVMIFEKYIFSILCGHALNSWEQRA